jgi:hypothetical protein
MNDINNSGIFRTMDILRRILLLFAAIFLIALIFWKYMYTHGIVSLTSMPVWDFRAGVVISIIAVLLFVYTEIIGLTYIAYRREKGVVTIKYYEAKLFGGKRRKIAIPENELIDAEIKTYYGGLQRELYLTRREQRGTAIYPPVNVSFIRKSAIDTIIRDLKQL